MRPAFTFRSLDVVKDTAGEEKDALVQTPDTRLPALGLVSPSEQLPETRSLSGPLPGLPLALSSQGHFG